MSLFLSLSTVITKARRYPLSYILSGRYYWGGNGGADLGLVGQNANGRFWFGSAYSDANAYHLVLDPQALYVANYDKTMGFPLR
ncbi:hypothetical protein IJG78_02160, partial [Candidatus Saccharibacteria bacterium]|nr:hypothetical protein [Candidatus Saccharibacteria bacterium]